MYRLVIVCPNEEGFITECTKYADFKNTSGVVCSVLPFSHKTERLRLLNQENRKFLQSEGINQSLLDDSAACLKVVLLQLYRTSGVRYVLLAGDIDKIPVPFSEFIQSGARYFYPTDLYYADLIKKRLAITRGKPDIFQTWDPDGDSVKGEFNPEQISLIDFKPDLSVGRIPASSAAELRVAFQRLMDRTYRIPRCLLLRGNDGQNNTQWLEDIKNEAANLLTARGYSVTCYSIDSTASESIEQNTLNQLYSSFEEGFEYIFWFGHGARDGWYYFGPNTSLWFSDIIKRTKGSPIIFSMSCSVGTYVNGVYDFIQYLSKGTMTSPSDDPNLMAPVPDSLQPKPSQMDADYAPEDWLVKNMQGATALIAGHSWGTLGRDELKTQPLDFIRSLPIPGEELQIEILGDAYNRMLFSYLEQFKQKLATLDNVPLNHLLRIHLFGDPTTPLFA